MLETEEYSKSNSISLLLVWQAYFGNIDQAIKRIIYAINISSIGGMLVHTRKENKPDVAIFYRLLQLICIFFDL